jgi:hypothetical protein
MGAKTALTNFQLPFDPTEMQEFDEFHDRFGKYVITALEK